MDKRPFLAYLNTLKDRYPSEISMIESIQNTFDNEFKAISNAEKMALRTLPEQFLKRIKSDDGNDWTTQLHIWGEQCVPDLLKLDPSYLAFKNSKGDTVLMSLMAGATGAFKEQIDYDLIRKILNTNLDYEDIDKDSDGNQIFVLKNPLDETDINDQTPIEYLVDFAYSTGEYEGHSPDDELINIIEEWTSQYKEDDEVEDEPSSEIVDDTPTEVNAHVNSEFIPIDQHAILYIDTLDKDVEDKYPSEIYQEPYKHSVKVAFIPDDEEIGETIFDVLRKNQK